MVRVKAKILGSAQDGGVPHLGCSCDRCSAARADPSKRRSAASLKLTEGGDGVNYLIDVSPDIRHQIGDEFIDGIFLSHAHLGHVTGLLYLGKESFNADEVPVHVSPTVAEFLRENPPYRLLIDRDNIDLQEYETGSPVNVHGLVVRPVQVPNEGYVTTDTTAFVIDSGAKTLFYMTDADEMTEEVVERVRDADVAVIDGCFWSREELERYEEVPHPPIQESMDALEDVDTEIYFTHLNHTNPVLEEDSAERAEVEERGFHVAEDGMTIDLS